MVNASKPTVEMLKEVKLLRSLTDAELGDLISLGTSANYEAHTNIVIEGELSWGLYCVIDGILGVFMTNKLTGENYDVGQIRSGGFFGEMSLVDDNPRSATVRALTHCQVFYISKDSFQAFLGRSQDLKSRFYESCIKGLVGRLRELNDNYVISQYQLWQSALKKEAA